MALLHKKMFRKNTYLVGCCDLILLHTIRVWNGM